MGLIVETQGSRQLNMLLVCIDSHIGIIDATILSHTDNAKSLATQDTLGFIES